jgi:hypothetical protein
MLIYEVGSTLASYIISLKNTHYTFLMHYWIGALPAAHRGAEFLHSQPVGNHFDGG